ncbi:MAG: hypothetical protein IT374_11540, partial [Polyangiaceae bacterium]|nr:hypothetical protein [Polyangiaceae bacterium]
MLAEHHDRAGDPRAAARHHLRAAEHALEGDDFARVIHHAERALQANDPDLDAAQAHELLADAHQTLA